MNMTREQKLARADEIFARVWGDDSRDGYDALDNATCDLRTWIEELADHTKGDGGNPWFTIAELVEKFTEVADRLEQIELPTGERKTA